MSTATVQANQWRCDLCGKTLTFLDRASVPAGWFQWSPVLGRESRDDDPSEPHLSLHWCSPSCVDGWFARGRVWDARQSHARGDGAMTGHLSVDWKEAYP